MHASFDPWLLFRLSLVLTKMPAMQFAHSPEKNKSLLLCEGRRIFEIHHSRNAPKLPESAADHVRSNDYVLCPLEVRAV